MKNLILLVGTFIFSSLVFGQGSACIAPVLLGTPTSTEVCTPYTTPGSGSSPCVGQGYGGGGSVIYINFCTNAANDCINFTMTDGASSGNWAVTIYTPGCGGVVDAQCLGSTGSGASFSTSSSGLSANTCYTARFWIKNGGAFTLCTEAMSPPNDNCSGATGIDGIPLSTDNYCTTPGPTSNTPTITPADLCAGSLENTAWYNFTVLSSTDVVITIDNIVCSGGGAGFQIGYFTGACGSLSNLGCSAGAGGTVTTTITGLTAGENVTIALDGNAGANCTFDISATNTIPLPIELSMFEADYIKEKKSVDLRWETVSEISNDYFTIEKTIDGYTYEVIGIVDGNGNSQMVNTYDLKDERPTKGTSYYRLAQTDFDGTTTYSKIVPVFIEASFGDLSVVPNPVTSNSKLSYTSDYASEATVKILDLAGKLIETITVESEKGSNFIELNTSTLNDGIYFVTIGNSIEVETIKFVKK